MDKLTFLRELENAGVSFVISVPSENGVDAGIFSPSQVLMFLTEPNAVYAKFHGVSLRDYLQWEAENASVQCSARTKAGNRCKNVVTGGASVSPKRWVELHGQYCDVHEFGR